MPAIKTSDAMGLVGCFLGSSTCVIKLCIPYKDLSFIKELIKNGASPIQNSQSIIHCALENQKPEIAQYIKSVIDNTFEAVVSNTDSNKQPKDAPHDQWHLMGKTIIVKTNSLVGKNRGQLVDYFDFAAQRMTRVQENGSVVTTLFHENFADVCDTPLYREALKRFEAEGGDTTLIPDTGTKPPVKLKTIKPGGAS